MYLVRLFIASVIFFFGAYFFVPEAFAGNLDIANRISPRNSERPERKSTLYIILHTTEGAEKGSLNKVCSRGEAHYFVCRNGRVYRIIDRNRVAFHTGRSMWNGRTSIDNYSIGIEVSGYHNKDITSSQYSSLKELLAQLQRIYRIIDSNVLTHSMVAYGAPNRWHRKSHRGRKRCGMLFASKSVRRRLGLTNAPLYDPDVRTGRLVVADPYLEKVLYGGVSDQEAAVARFVGQNVDMISEGRSAWDIARDSYASEKTIYVFPAGKKYRGSEISDWTKIPVGTKVVLSRDQPESDMDGYSKVDQDGVSAKDVAGDEYGARGTVYIMPDGMVRTGDRLDSKIASNLPVGTVVLLGYVHGGYITPKRSAFDVCKEHWNFPDTLYRIPGKGLVQGNKIDETSIPSGTLVFFRR